MTAEELIEALMKCNPKAKVFADQEYDEEFLVQEVVPDKSGHKIVLRVN